MQFDLVSAASGFLFGAITGAASTYLGNRFTDQRRRSEARHEASSTFAKVCETMPDLIKEMREDLAREPHVRSFYVLPEGARLGGSSVPAFVYYESSSKSMLSWVHILENHGYVHDITPKNTPMYRMTEEFVELVTKREGFLATQKG